MISEKINEMVNEEVEKAINSKLKKLQRVELERSQLRERTTSLLNENQKLKNKIETLKNSEEFIDKFTPLVTKDNFESFVTSLNINGTGIEANGMNSEDIPVWFVVMVKYYNHKSLILDLMELFNIDFPEWARTFRLPYDYNEEELDLFFENIYRASVTNNCYFKDNMGFYYRNLSAHKGHVIKLLKSSNYFQIPWDLLLQNNLLTTDKFFNKILEELDDSAHISKNEFFRIQEYQKLSEQQVSQMLDKLPKDRFYREHDRFVKNNADTFKIKPELVNRFLDRIEDNQFSAFYYLNYPVEIQKDFIKRYSTGYYNKLNLVKRMSINKKEKVELLVEIAEIELEINDD